MLRLPSAILAAAAFALLSLAFSACGDDSSSGSGNGEKEEGSVETVDDLGKCLSAFEGDTYFVKEKNGSYVCESSRWVPVPGVGEWTDSLAAGTVRKEIHKALANYGESLVCADSAWRPTTDVEIALKNACVESLDGKFRNDSTDKKKVKHYVCAGNLWREATDVERAANVLCTKGNEASFATDSSDKKNVKVYVCKDSLWREATDVERAANALCPKGNEASFATDSSDKKNVKVYVCKDSLWLEASAGEQATRALCTKDNEGSFATDSSDKKNVKVYVCKDSLWLEASAIEQAAGKVCNKNAYGLFVADSADKKLPLYVCNGEMFLPATEAEQATRLICDSTSRGDTLNFWACDGSEWQKDTTSTLGECTDKNEGDIEVEKNPFRIFGLHATAGDSSHVCDGSQKKWRTATPGEAATGKLCTEKVDGDTLNWFVCDAASNDWVAVLTSGLGKCDANSLDSIRTEPNPNLKKKDSLFVCVCDGGIYGWKILEKSLLGECGSKLQDSVRVETNPNLKTFESEFVCDASKWEKASGYEFADGIPCMGNLNAKVVGDKLCQDGKWRDATDSEIEMGATCNAETENVVVSDKGRVCKSGQWVTASAGEIATGKVYLEALSKELDYEMMNGYVCEKSGKSYAWRTANAAEKKYLKTCSKFTYDSGVLANAYQYGYVCDASLNYAWREVYGTNEKNTVLAASSHMKFTEREVKS
ncbi:hypothetical protein [uncultured Fibrobacter sp.]|uniref:hypothetical protein n=1 Tax=uncultured Fibrobacter sp. TaxID=261512 RepID=UPI00280475AC|nr:hypothetical protein [uncultured Fibrobacter sp.]